MTQAACSGRQNIIKGSATSKDTEMKLTDVARASLSELRGDYEFWILDCGQLPWSVHSPEAKTINAISLDAAPFAEDMVHESAKHALEQRRKYAQWLDADDDLVVANAMLVIIGRALNMLKSQIEAQGAAFEETGGFNERLMTKRLEVRVENGLPHQSFTGTLSFMSQNPDVRWRQRLQSFRKAFGQLSNATNLAKERELSELEQQGLIQAFEFTHELAWNTLKDFLESRGVTEIFGSKDATRKAFAEELLDDGNVWMEMIASRNRTSHTYNEEIADEISEAITSAYVKQFESFLQRFTDLESRDL